jgi:hypothetical protein
MLPSGLEQALVLLSGALVVAVLLRWAAAGLIRPYRYFALFLAFSLVRDLAGIALLSLRIAHRTQLYANFWCVTTVLLWILYLLIAYELYSSVLDNYPGISALGRSTVVALFGISIGVVILTLGVDLQTASTRFDYILRYFTVTERALSSTMVFLLLGISAFLAWFPVPLPRNVVTHCLLLAAYFLSKGFAYLVRNVAGADVTRTVSTGVLLVWMLCLLGWLVFMTRKGQQAIISLRERWDPSEQERLLGQLQAMNALLLRATRK